MRKQTQRRLRAGYPNTLSKSQWRRVKKAYNGLNWQQRTAYLMVCRYRAVMMHQED